VNPIFIIAFAPLFAAVGALDTGAAVSQHTRGWHSASRCWAQAPCSSSGVRSTVGRRESLDAARGAYLFLFRASSACRPSASPRDVNARGHVGVHGPGSSRRRSRAGRGLPGGATEKVERSEITTCSAGGLLLHLRRDVAIAALALAALTPWLRRLMAQS
jgi:hypothetical protein